MGPKPGPLLELGLVGGLKVEGCSVLCSVQQHSTNIPGRDWQRAPWCQLTAAVSGCKDRRSHGRGVPVSLVAFPVPRRLGRTPAPRGSGALPASHRALEGSALREHPHGEGGRATRV